LQISVPRTRTQSAILMEGIPAEGERRVLFDGPGDGGLASVT
jgi:hypothetical protein